jgi:hypothetical protein
MIQRQGIKYDFLDDIEELDDEEYDPDFWLCLFS